MSQFIESFFFSLNITFFARSLMIRTLAFILSHSFTLSVLLVSVKLSVYIILSIKY